MTDHLTKEKRSWNMSRIRSKNTKPEMIVRSFLFSKGFRYRLHNRKLPGKPDISNASKKIAVFVNGCFWHRHKNCKRSSIPKSNKKYWLNKLDNNIKRQEYSLNLLDKMGWNTFIIWECETKQIEDNKRVKDILDV